MNRTRKILLIAVLLTVAVILILLILDVRQKQLYERIREQYQEMVSLSADFAHYSNQVYQVERRIGLSQPESLPVIFEKLLSGMGLKKKIRSIKPFGGGLKGDFDIQEAEVVIDNITLNELVNILYAIYTLPSGLIVTSAEFESDFSERILIDSRLSLKLIRQKKEDYN